MTCYTSISLLYFMLCTCVLLVIYLLFTSHDCRCYSCRHSPTSTPTLRTEMRSSPASPDTSSRPRSTPAWYGSRASLWPGGDKVELCRTGSRAPGALCLIGARPLNQTALCVEAEKEQWSMGVVVLKVWTLSSDSLSSDSLSFFVELERDVGGGAGVRHHAVHLEELLTSNTTGNHWYHRSPLVLQVTTGTTSHYCYHRLLLLPQVTIVTTGNYWYHR